MKEELLSKWFDRPIAYHRIFVDLTGSVGAALMLSQAFYWNKRTKDPDGWFYKSAAEWAEETGLSRHEQDSARKALRKSTFWKEKLKGVPATVNFKIDISALFFSLTEVGNLDSAHSEFAVNRQTGLPVDGKLLYTETTTETTNAELRSSASQKSLFEDKGNGSKKDSSSEPSNKAPKDLVYAECVRLWCHQYPELGFNAVSGKKIKDMITASRAIVKEREDLGIANLDIPVGNRVIGVFQYILNYARSSNNWAHGKSITTFESKYREIYNEIINGKPKQKTGQRRSVHDFQEYIKSL